MGRYNPASPVGIDVPNNGGGWSPAPPPVRVAALPQPSLVRASGNMHGRLPPELVGKYPVPMDLDTFTLGHLAWMPLHIERPTILWPIRSTIAAAAPGTIASGSFYPVYYRPNTMFANTPAQIRSADGDTFQVSQVSQGPGIVYLPQPGKWWLFCGVAATDSTTFLKIDASDIGVLSKYLAEPGCHRVSVNAQVAAGVADTVILAANRNRKAMQIFNVSTFAACLGFGAAATATTYPLQVPAAASPNSSLFMSGPTVWLGDIHAIRNAANDATLQVIEWE